MVWFATLVGFWLAFVTAGLVSAVVGIFALTRISSKYFSCFPILLLCSFSYLILFLLTYMLVPQEYWNPSYDPQKLQLDAFVAEMSPSLQKKISQLREQQTQTVAKIRKLKKLRNDHPNFSERVTTEIAKWQELETSIEKTLGKIREQTEKALVDYQIDEISGRKKFSSVSKDLQEEAERVLDLAGVLQAAIEKQTSQKDESDQIKSLEDLLKETQ